MRSTRWIVTGAAALVLGLVALPAAAQTDAPSAPWRGGTDTAPADRPVPGERHAGMLEDLTERLGLDDAERDALEAAFADVYDSRIAARLAWRAEREALREDPTSRPGGPDAARAPRPDPTPGHEAMRDGLADALEEQLGAERSAEVLDELDRHHEQRHEERASEHAEQRGQRHADREAHRAEREAARGPHGQGRGPDGGAGRPTGA